jgi:hypothetical protein
MPASLRQAARHRFDRREKDNRIIKIQIPMFAETVKPFKCTKMVNIGVL